MAVFWVVAPCSLVEVYQRFRGETHRPDDGGSKDLWNFGKLLPDYNGASTQNTAIFVLTAVRTLDPMKLVATWQKI
jgi:hypothetical protein